MTSHPFDDTLARLAHHVHAFDTQMLDERVLTECRRRVIDAAACAVAAREEPFVVRMQAFSGQFAGPLMARVWGSGQRSSVEMAAFANGTAVRYLDLSDTYMSRNAGHPSDMIGGLVAVAESARRDGRSLVAAVVVAYEVYCGLCDAVALRDKGIDQALCAAVGTAAGAARLMGLNAAQTAQALSLALSANLHVYNVRKGALSEWKGCAGPNACRNGIFAAQLALQGVSGPTTPVEGAGGLFDIVGAFDWQVGELSTARIADTHIKLHPVCYHGQCAMDAVQVLRPQVAIEDIAEIHVDTYEAAFLMMGDGPERWAPANRETADHSLPFAVATGLIDGRLTAASYEQDRLTDPAILQLMRKVQVHLSAEFTGQFPRLLPTRVSIRAHSGDVFTHVQQLPRGHAQNPVSDEDIDAKFLAIYEAWRGRAEAKSALEVLRSVDRLPCVDRLVDVLCAPSPSTATAVAHS